jgi:hypothetical protein
MIWGVKALARDVWCGSWLVQGRVRARCLQMTRETARRGWWRARRPVEFSSLQARRRATESVPCVRVSDSCATCSSLIVCSASWCEQEETIERGVEQGVWTRHVGVHCRGRSRRMGVGVCPQASAYTGANRGWWRRYVPETWSLQACKRRGCDRAASAQVHVRRRLNLLMCAHHLWASVCGKTRVGNGTDARERARGCFR